HLVVLVSDLWGPGVAAVLAVFFAGCAFLVWAAGRLVGAMQPLFLPDKRRQLLVVGAAAWALVLGATFVGRPAKEGDPAVHWLTRDVIQNARESRGIYAEIERGIRESPYRDYDRIELRRTPNVSILFVESYGRIVSDSDDLRPRWSARLAEM